MNLVQHAASISLIQPILVKVCPMNPTTIHTAFIINDNDHRPKSYIGAWALVKRRIPRIVVIPIIINCGSNTV